MPRRHIAMPDITRLQQSSTCVARGPDGPCGREARARGLCPGHYDAVRDALGPLERERATRDRREAIEEEGGLQQVAARVSASSLRRLRAAAREKGCSLYLFVADILEGRETWPPPK